MAELMLSIARRLEIISDRIQSTGKHENKLFKFSRQLLSSFILWNSGFDHYNGVLLRLNEAKHYVNVTERKCKEDTIYVFPELKLRGLVPNFHIHNHEVIMNETVPFHLWDIFFQFSEQGLLIVILHYV